MEFPLSKILTLQQIITAKPIHFLPASACFKQIVLEYQTVK